MTTSFPYLQVARAYDVDYWRVLQFADLLDARPPKPEDWGLPHTWMVATCLAWRNEAERRAKPPEVIMSVRGDCGQIHPTVKGWQDCAVCGAILKSRTS